MDLSTNSPTTIRRIAAAGAERGIVVLDAPVSGGVFGAESGRLAVMVGGDRAAFERCKPTVRRHRRPRGVLRRHGAGAATKLVNNMISLSLNVLLGEALALGVRAGVDLRRW